MWIYIIGILGLFIYLFVVHAVFGIRTSPENSKTYKKFIHFMVSENHPRNLTNDRSVYYTPKAILTMEKWLIRFGYDIKIEFNEKGMDIDYVVKSEPKNNATSKWIMAKVLTSLELLFYPIGSNEP